MTVTIAPLAAEQIGTLCALAREIWRQHYPAIIGTAQTEYMLAQRYDPEVVRAELAREEAGSRQTDSRPHPALQHGLAKLAVELMEQWRGAGPLDAACGVA